MICNTWREVNILSKCQIPSSYGNEGVLKIWIFTRIAPATPGLLIMPIQSVLQTIYNIILKKLDGVGPVDNRPSTDKLHALCDSMSGNTILI